MDVVRENLEAVRMTWEDADNTLLKSDVTTRDHMVRCRGSQECGSRNVNFACKFLQNSHNSEIYNIVVHAH